jgi:Skp family chaperone for outer membrane proteins
MQTLAFLAVVASIGFILWSLFGAVFATGRRRKRLKLAGVGGVLLIGALVFLVDASNQVAREAGYDDINDKTAADNAGVTDPSVWKAHKEEAKRLADQQKAKADEVAARQAQISAEKTAAEDKAADEKAAADAKAEAARCRQDIQCWAEGAFVAASFACTDAVQALAKWDYEWTDGWSEPKLERYRWKDKDKGIVTYIGTKIKFQNGFGAWKHMTYSCDYDPASKSVVSASAF